MKNLPRTALVLLLLAFAVRASEEPLLNAESRKLLGSAATNGSGAWLACS